MPCCPRKPVPAKHCPVSSDLQVCPLYTTAGKIGIAKDKFEIAKLSGPRASVTRDLGASPFFRRSI